MSIKVMKTTIAAIMMVCAASTSWPQERRTVVSDQSTIVATQQGKVQGYKDGGVFTFKGIQYAEAERFMPPVRPKAHDGVRMCRIYGPKAPQGETLRQNGDLQSDYDFGFQFNLEPMDEARCLVLNVWTKGINDGRKRPVFVWLHGGGFSTGSGIDLPCYEGRALAEKGDIVVVTLNHRLNVLGFFDMSGLGGRFANSANLGMQDIVAALEWVRDNIENFGGDPSSVTIGGQSGGGGKVSTLMMMPAAKGLFHRAIVQSGSFTRYGTNDDSHIYAKALLDELGIQADDAERLNAVPYDQLVEAVNKSSRVVNNALGKLGGGMCGPVIDGKHVVAPGFDQRAPEINTDVPMIIGWNYNEFDFTSGKEDTLFRDGAIRQATLKAEQGGAPVYLYLFNWKPAGNSLGACHGMELAFTFNNIALQSQMNGATSEAYNLADKMSSAWLSFIKTGNPNTKSIPTWLPFTLDNKVKMVFDNKCYLTK